MHILHINDLYGQMVGEETEQYIPTFCTLLERAGHAWSVIYGTDSAGVCEHYGSQVQHVQRVGDWSHRPDWRKLAHVLAIVAALRPDVIEVHQVADSYLVEALSAHVPVVAFVHNHIFTCPSGSRLKREPLQVCTDRAGMACLPKMLVRRCGSRQPGALYDGMLRLRHTQRMLRYVERVVVDAAYMRDLLVQHGCEAPRVSVSPSITEVRSGWSPVPTAFEVLYVGGLTENKGPHHLIKALAGLDQPWHLTVVGDGYFRQDLEWMVTYLGCRDRVDFVGWVHRADMGHYYDAARVVVMPSLWPEPLGLVGSEAMAHGRPVVAYDVGGIREWLADGETGLLAPFGDIEALGERIARLLDDYHYAQCLGLAGRIVLERRLHPQQHLVHMLDVYACAITDWHGRRFPGGCERRPPVSEPPVVTVTR